MHVCEIRIKGANLYGDAGQFDGHCGINLENRNQRLYTEPTLSSFIGSDNCVLEVSPLKSS